MLACRGCRRPLSAAEGCALCAPVKRHLVAVDEDADEAPSLAGTATEVVAALRAQLRHVRGVLKADPNSDAEGRLIGLGNTAAKVLESARKLQQDGVQAIEAMSFAERAELFVTWFSTLPPAYRSALREKLEAWEVEAAKPVTLPPPAPSPQEPAQGGN